jgi:class 3 adenylate cyclase/predicted ATPase
MTRLEEEIAALRAAIARRESAHPAKAEDGADASLALLRSQLAQLQQSAAPAAGLESERKVVTILFADISGFTALAETLDPEAARELVDCYFQRMTPIIEKFGGTIEKFIGDEVMAMFGAPVASENDAECALRTALEMLEEFTRFNTERELNLGVHVGINTGLVIAGSLGTRGREQYAVTGDAVNVASRLRGAAERGQIFVGLDTYRLTVALFDFEKRPPLPVKGKANPLDIYRLIRAKKTPANIRGIEGLRSPLVGREKEFHALQRALNKLREGRGATVAILGEAGLGKSRLVAEIRQSLGAGTCWVEARALSYGERLSYGVARDLIEGLAGIDEDTPAAEGAKVLRARVEALFPERTGEVFPYLARLCDLPLEEKMAERVKYLTPEALHGHLMRSFQEYVRARALSERLVLVWEDLHWVDPSSLRLLETLLPLTSEVPLLVLLVCRSFDEGHVRGFYERTLAAAGALCQRIELSPLTRQKSTELAGNLLRIQNLPEETLVLDRAEGNPFFMEELLRGLLDAGLVTVGEGYAAALSQAAAAEVPRTLQGLIAARIDRLAPPDKSALQAASVIGRIFQCPVLRNLIRSEQERVRLDISLGELERRELIRQREAERHLPDPEYIFKHAITQEVTYQSVSLARRKVLHRMSAEAIQTLFPDRVEELAATLAYHYERAEESEQAIHYLTKAADRARASYANEEALKFYGAAIKQADRLKAKQASRWAELAPRLQESLGDTLLDAARYEDARAAYGQALGYVGENDRVCQARLLRKKGNSWHNQRRAEESVASFDLAETALGRRPDNDDAEWWKEWMAIGLDRIGPYYFLNRLADLAALIQEIQPAVERYGTPSQHRETIDSLNLIETRQSRYYMIPDRTLARARRLLAESRESGDLRDMAHYQFMIGFMQCYRDEFDAAVKELESALALTVRIGDVAEQTKCLTYLALIHRKLSHPEETEGYASRSLSVARQAQNSAYAGSALANLAWVAWRRGNLAQAENHARTSVELVSRNYPWRLFALWPLFGISLARQQMDQAVDCARGILEPEQCQLPPDLSAALEAAIGAFERSDVETARARFQQASELAGRIGYL